MSELIHNNRDADLMSACYAYIKTVKDIEELGVLGLYGADKLRVKMHDQILALSGLTREELYGITNNLDQYERGDDLYIAIVDISMKKKRDIAKARELT